MKLTSFLPKEAIGIQLKSRTGEEVLRELASYLCEADPSLSINEVYNVLEEREKLGSTGIGAGIAIPHGKLAQSKKMIAAFGRSKSGIDFQSQDGELTHLFFALIAPENAAGMHLKILAKLSRLLKDKHFREKLLEAKNADEVFTILSEEDSKGS